MEHKIIYIYMVTRDDGKRYIGQTWLTRFNKRKNEHRISPRFKGHNFLMEPIFMCYSQEEADLKESEYIKLYDTFTSGLNKTFDGSGDHRNKKLTTKGFKFSEDSKQKMSESAKKKVFTDEWRANLSKSQKGRKCWCKGKATKPQKLSREQVLEIRELYKQRPEFERVGFIGNNGRPITYENEFSKAFSGKYGVSAQMIRGIITGKSRKYDV